METNAHLQQMNEDKNRIMQIVSHDLRSPLSGIKGLAKILQTEDDAGDPDTVREFSTMIADTADMLTRLVNDLLNVTRIEAGAQIELQPVKCNLNELLLSCINIFCKLAEKKNIRFEYKNLSADASAFIDQPKITQVVNNLLSNAVKFTHGGGSIHIVLQDNPGATTPGFILSVRDTGIGIPTEQIPYLFQKFSEGRRSGTNNERGVGLGLPIVHSFVQLHGGKVKIQSEEGRGTTVEVTLPRTLRQSEPASRTMQNGSLKK
jgi:signal transduction histidine kinase